MRGKLARQPTGSLGHSPIWRIRQRRLRQRRYETAVRTRFFCGNGYRNGYGEREHNTGNKA